MSNPLEEGEEPLPAGSPADVLGMVTDSVGAAVDQVVRPQPSGLSDGPDATVRAVLLDGVGVGEFQLTP